MTARAAGAVMLLALLAGCRPETTPSNDQSGPVDPKTINTLTVCANVRYYIAHDQLDTHDAEATLKLEASKSSVSPRLRAAIDSYYRGDRAAGKQAMIDSCRKGGG